MVVVSDVHLRQTGFVFVNYSASILLLSSIFNKTKIFFCHPVTEIVLRDIYASDLSDLLFFATLNMPVTKTMSRRVFGYIFLLFQ